MMTDADKTVVGVVGAGAGGVELLLAMAWRLRAALRGAGCAVIGQTAGVARAGLQAVEVDDPGVLVDVDTVADLAQVRAHFSLERMIESYRRLWSAAERRSPNRRSGAGSQLGLPRARGPAQFFGGRL